MDASRPSRLSTVTGVTTVRDTADRVAIITGAAGGIGEGMARACAEDGMRVVVADVDAARAAEAAGELRRRGATALDCVCDVRSFAETNGLREFALERFGRIDLVCLNAGLGLVKAVADCSDVDWTLMFDVNVTGVINGIRVFLPTMINQGFGHLSATASLSGLVADPDLAIYNGTKFAVVGIMESLAMELRRDHPRIGASVLCPGPVATDIVANSAKVLSDAGTDMDHPDKVAGYLARGRSPTEVGRLAIDGIEAGHFWLLPHPDLTFELLKERTSSMRDRRLYAPEEQWTDQGASEPSEIQSPSSPISHPTSES